MNANTRARTNNGKIDTYYPVSPVEKALEILAITHNTDHGLEPANTIISTRGKITRLTASYGNYLLGHSEDEDELSAQQKIDHIAISYEKMTFRGPLFNRAETIPEDYDAEKDITYEYAHILTPNREAMIGLNQGGIITIKARDTSFEQAVRKAKMQAGLANTKDGTLPEFRPLDLAGNEDNYTQRRDVAINIIRTYFTKGEKQ